MAHAEERHPGGGSLWGKNYLLRTPHSALLLGEVGAGCWSSSCCCEAGTKQLSTHTQFRHPSGQTDILYPFCADNNLFKPWSKNEAAALQTHHSLLTPLIWLKANKPINKTQHFTGKMQQKIPFFSVSRSHQLLVQRQRVMFKNPVLVFYKTLDLSWGSHLPQMFFHSLLHGKPLS